MEEVSNKISKIGEEAYKAQPQQGAPEQEGEQGQQQSSENSQSDDQGPTVEGQAKEV
jgi:hypothetical protein